MVSFAGNTVLSMSERVRGVREEVLYKLTLPLPLHLPPGKSTGRDGRFYAHFRRKTVSDSHFPPNRMQKYGRHRTNELAATDFLFDFVYIMGYIYYFRVVWRNGKVW